MILVSQCISSMLGPKQIFPFGTEVLLIKPCGDARKFKYAKTVERLLMNKAKCGHMRLFESWPKEIPLDAKVAGLYKPYVQYMKAHIQLNGYRSLGNVSFL